MRTRAFAIAALVMFLALMAWPSVRAEDVRVGLAFVALPDNAIRNDKLANLANVSDVSLSNFNQTWEPFFDANPDLKGVTVTPLTVPAIIQQPASNLEAVQRITFTSDQIISGSSVSFWRSPIGNFTNTTLVTFRLFRVDPTSDNLTSIGPTGPLFQDQSQVREIYRYSGYPGSDFPVLARTMLIPVLADTAHLTWTNLSSTIQDTFAWETFPANNYGTSEQLTIAQKDSGFQRNRVFAKWDPAAIPDGSVIVHANLTYTQFGNGAPIVVGQKIGAYGAKQTWTEAGLTWGSQPSADGTADSNVTTTDVPFPAGPKAKLSWNVTRSFKAGFDAGTNRGVVLKYLDESAPRDQAVFLSSSENATVGLRPTLWVQWAPPKALYKFAYIAVRAPIFTVKNYFAYWNFSGAGPQNYHLYYSEGDVAQDGAFNSWVKINGVGSTLFVPADLDQSVLFTKGMANGLAGLVPDCSFYSVACSGNPRVDFFIDSTVTIGGPTSPTFLNMVFPVRDTNVSGDPVTPDIIVDVLLDFASGPDAEIFAHDIVLKDANALGVTYWNLTAENGGVMVGRQLKRVYFTFVMFRPGNYLWTSAKDTASWTNLSMFLPDPPYYENVTFRFDMYGYFSVDPFFFENTNRNIVLLPFEEPDTPLGKLEAFQAWKASLRPQPTVANCTAQLESRAWSYILTLGQKALIDLVTGDPCLTNAVLAGTSFLLNTVYSALVPIFGADSWLFKIGSWIWQALTFVISAIQWFLFWTVKIVNVFLVAVVFSIVVLAPSYIGKSFLEWVKSGYDVDVLREVLNEGWSKVWGLIHIVIMLVIMALTAISAVIPF